MNNLLVKKLSFLFEQVEAGTIPAYKAMNNFLAEYGGKSIFIPGKVFAKKEIIIMAYDNGDNAKVISKRYNISINYVYRIIAEYNGEEFRKRLYKSIQNESNKNNKRSITQETK